MKRKGFTLIELLVVVAIIALLISILLPSLARAREITKRAVCASNLRGIGQSMKVYANDNFDYFPTAPFQEGEGGSTDGTNAVEYTTYSSYLYKKTAGTTGFNTDAQLYTKTHPSRCLFLLVIDGTCTAKQFICPSAGDNEDDLRVRQGSQDQAAQLGQNRFDFKGYPYYSYGYQLPYGPRAKPNEGLDTRMALLADKGPYFEPGQQSTDQDSGVRDKAVEGQEQIAGPGNQIGLLDVDISNPIAILGAPNDSWRTFNSRNHAGEGENVCFIDGHVDFAKRPIVGVNYDNIYTFQGEGGSPSWTLVGSLLGNQPGTPFLGPFTQTDSVIVP